MSNITTFCSWAGRAWLSGGSKYSLPYKSDYSSLQGGLANEGNLRRPVSPWKSIEEVQQILSDLGMKQANYTPEDPDQATFIAQMKAKILLTAPSVWYGTLIPTQSPAMGQHIFGVGQLIVDLGENNKSWEQVRERLRQGARETKSYPNQL